MMPGKIPEDKVRCVSQGEGKGVNVPISATHLEEVNIDPDEPVLAKRYTYNDRDGRVMLVLENEEEDG
jgi:hypothetical protein